MTVAFGFALFHTRKPGIAFKFQITNAKRERGKDGIANASVADKKEKGIKSSGATDILPTPWLTRTRRRRLKKRATWKPYQNFGRSHRSHGRPCELGKPRRQPRPIHIEANNARCSRRITASVVIGGGSFYSPSCLGRPGKKLTKKRSGWNPDVWRVDRPDASGWTSALCNSRKESRISTPLKTGVLALLGLEGQSTRLQQRTIGIESEEV